jgi:hypothetical protein
LFEALCDASNDGVVKVTAFFEDSDRIPVDAIRDLARAGLIKVDDLVKPTRSPSTLPCVT